MILHFVFAFFVFQAASQPSPHYVSINVGYEDYATILPTSQVNTLVENSRVRTLMDILFTVESEISNNNRLEANVRVQLPPEAKPFFLMYGTSQNATVSSTIVPEEMFTSEGIVKHRANLWTQQTVTEAVMVKKALAARAYSDQVRRNVDPALLEESLDNAYTIRIFPVQQKTVYRVVLGYDADIFAFLDEKQDSIVFRGLSGKDDGEENNFGQVSVNILNFVASNQERSDYNMSYANETVTIALKSLLSHENALLVTSNPKQHFSTSFFVPSPEPKTVVANNTASRIIFLLDTSFSERGDKFRAHLNMIENTLAVLRNNHPSRDVVFNVAVFNIRTWLWKPLGQYAENTESNVKAFLDTVSRITPLGASDLVSAVKYIHSHQDSTITDIILCSDGVLNWGPHEDVFPLASFLQHERKSGHVVPRITAYVVNRTLAKIETLRKVAESSGGEVVHTDEDVVKSVIRNVKHLEVANVRVHNHNMEVYVDRIQRINGEYLFVVVGRGELAGIDSMVFELSFFNHPNIVVTVTNFVRSILATRHFGIVAVTKLHQFLPESLQTAQTFSIAYRVVGKTASLLMLESQDYAQYGIDPISDGVKAMDVAGSLRIDHYLDRLTADKGKSFSRSGLRPSLRHIIQHDINSILTNAGVRIKKIPEDLWVMHDILPEEAFAIYDNNADDQNVAFMEQYPVLLSAPFLAELESAKHNRVSYDVLLKEAERFATKDNSIHALTVYSSLLDQMADISGDEMDLLRDVAATAWGWTLPREALDISRRIVQNRPFEPLGIVNIAKYLNKMGMPEASMLYFETVLSGEWSSNYQDLQKYTSFLYSEALQASKHLPTKFVQQRRQDVISNSGVPKSDVVVSLTWSSDNSDVDLHVHEPGNVRCSYSNPVTTNGGTLSRDVTTGFGPELYFLPVAPDGEYVVSIDFFSIQRSASSARTRVVVDVVKHWGCNNEEHLTYVRTLSSDTRKQVVEKFVIQGPSCGENNYRRHIDTAPPSPYLNTYGGVSSRTQARGAQDAAPTAAPSVSLADTAYGMAQFSIPNEDPSRPLNVESMVLLCDVTPLSIGIETLGGMMVPIVHRNTPIPTRKQITLTTTHDDQEIITVVLFEGEGERSHLNIPLHTFNITGIPKGPKGHVHFTVFIEIDENGIPSVTVKDSLSTIYSFVMQHNRHDSQFIEKHLFSMEEAKANSNEASFPSIEEWMRTHPYAAIVV